MPFARPTLTDLVARVRADLWSRLASSAPLLRRATANVLAPVWAGAVHMLHGHLEWVADQLFADTASEEYLLRAAALYGLTPNPATYWQGTATATGTNGTTIPVGTVLVHASGETYEVDADVTISGGTATMALTAVNAGAGPNLDAAESLDFESPIANVDSSATVATVVADGADQESVDALRARLIARLREPPAGGREPDYVAWALTVSGVTRAWVYPHENGLGTVVLRFVRDGDPSAIPDAGEVAAVQAALDAERPITAEVTAAAPTALTVDYTIAIEPDTAALRDAVEAELTDLFDRDAAPGDGAGQGEILLSRMRTAIGTAGVTDYTLTTPAADVVPGVGQLPVLGTITWA